MAQNSNKPNALFWIVATIALIWNGIGILNYLTQAYMTVEMKASMPEAQVEFMENRPSWATAAFAIAVFGGTLGAILLFFRKKLAFTLFVLSFLGVIVQMASDVFMNSESFEFSVAEISLTGLIVAIGIFLIIYSKSSYKKGWLS